MVIQIQFQNLPSANNEILKAFNSHNAARALEAYQPLSIKDRKREKLRALQLLKQTSHSSTLADISLGADTLALALARAEGATLQAMLNLLSAKMIEQNKYMAYAQAKAEQERREAEAKAREEIIAAQAVESEQEDAQEEEPQDIFVTATEEQKRDYIQELLVTATDYLNQLRAQISKSYARVLDAVSLEHIQNYIDESIKTLRKLVIETPIDFANEHIIEPLREMPIKVKKFIDIKIKSALDQDLKTTFSAEEIKSILSRSALAKANAAKLNRTINTMDQSLRIHNAKQAQKQVANSARRDMKLALHNV